MHYGRILDLRDVFFFFNVAISFSFFSTITITSSTRLNRRDPVQKNDFNTGESAQETDQATLVEAGNPQFKQGRRIWNSALQ